MGSGGARPAQQREQLLQFRGFLATLRADLAKAQEARDRVQADIQAYEDLQANVQLLQQASGRAPGGWNGRECACWRALPTARGCACADLQAPPTHCTPHVRMCTCGRER